VVGRDSEAGLNCIGTGDARLIEIVGGTIADQDFIASAREDMPMLIAEVRRLTTLLKVVQRDASEHLFINQSKETSQSVVSAQ
jgi:hypothetical protein